MSSVVMFIVMSNPNLGFKLPDLGEGNSSLLKVVVVFEWHVSRIELIVWGTVGFLEAAEFLSHLHLSLHLSAKVPVGEDSVVWDSVVQCMRLVVVVVLEV